MRSVLNATGIALEFPDGRELFGPLNFTLDRGTTALVGPNGIGKTCLARLLAGEIEPSRGVIQRIETLPLFPQRDVAPEIAVEGYLAHRYSWSIAGERLLSGIDRALPCSALSGGQWKRVRLAGFLQEGYLILDEPSNDLDREGRCAVLQFLRQHQGGVLLISHDREFLQLCDRVLELSSLGLSRFGGGWEAYRQARERERTNAQAALELAKRERERVRARRVEQRERQDKRGRHGKRSAEREGMSRIEVGARKRQAEATSAKIDAATLERTQEAVSAAFRAFAQIKVDPVMYARLAGREIPAQRLVAQASGFNVRFAEWLYPRDLTFCWKGCTRVAIKGGNGSGKSTLLKAILGQRLETRGELRRGQLSTLYVDQECAQLDNEKSVLENVMATSQADYGELRNELAKLLFQGDSVYRKVGQLSGGERLRAALAQGLLSAEQPELMMLDEPTNNLDLLNVEFLEGLLRGFRGALLVISHDDTFLANCGIENHLEIA